MSNSPIVQERTVSTNVSRLRRMGRKGIEGSRLVLYTAENERKAITSAHFVRGNITFDSPRFLSQRGQPKEAISGSRMGKMQVSVKR